jgi:hypothetical protein
MTGGYGLFREYDEREGVAEYRERGSRRVVPCSSEWEMTRSSSGIGYAGIRRQQTPDLISTYSSINLVPLILRLLLDEEKSMIEQEDLEITAVTLGVAAFLENAFVHELTTLFSQTQVLSHLISRRALGRISRRTTCSPGRKTNCWSSWRRLKRFSVFPDSVLTLPRKSRTRAMTCGRTCLSG